MEEEPDEPRWPRFRDAIPEATGAVAGAVVSTWTKDPYIGTAIAPFVATGARFVTAYEDFHWARVGAVLYYANQEDPELDLEHPPVEDLGRMELTARVLRAAGRTPMGEKIRALGRVLARGLDPGGKVDEALLLAGALDDLEAPHVELLGAMYDAGQRIECEASGWSTADMVAARPGLEDVVGSVLHTLERHDLIRENSATWPGGHGWGFVGPFAVTQLGGRCLELLREDQSNELAQ